MILSSYFCTFFSLWKSAHSQVWVCVTCNPCLSVTQSNYCSTGAFNHHRDPFYTDELLKHDTATIYNFLVDRTTECDVMRYNFNFRVIILWRGNYKVFRQRACEFCGDPPLLNSFLSAQLSFLLQNHPQPFSYSQELLKDQYSHCYNRAHRLWHLQLIFSNSITRLTAWLK